jgi:Dynamin family
LREALDQTGALLGPLLIAAILYLKGGYPTGNAVLAVPAVLSLIVLSVGRVLYPRPRDVEVADALVYVVVIGEFKRGKSTLINALLGEDVLPTGVTPVTAVPTLVRFGPGRDLPMRWQRSAHSPRTAARLRY